MKHRILGMAGAATMVAGLALTSAGTAGANTWGGSMPAPAAPSTNLDLVHGIPNTPVDIYIVKNLNLWNYKELSNVNFGTAANLNTAIPGFITPGFYTIDIVPTGANPFKPLLLANTWLSAGQSKTAVAYVTADASGTAGSPKLGVFTNNLSSTSGQARVQVTHTAVAPTVGVCADGAVPVVPAFSNGQQAAAVVPAGTYDVSVTAPVATGSTTCGASLADIGNVTLTADTTTLAYAIGTYGSSFTVAALQIPNNPPAPAYPWGWGHWGW